MKHLKLTIACLFLCSAIHAQTPQSLNDTLTARFNRGDYKGFYALGSVQWQQNNKEEGIEGWLNYIQALCGSIKTAHFDHAAHDTSYFTWDGQKKMMSFLLKTSGSGHFDSFDFRDYHLPATAIALQPIPTDNPRKTRLDMAVHNSTVDFMVTHKLIGLSIGIVRDGKKYTYNYGTVEKGKAQLPGSTTTFELASVTKTFTGILLAQAILDKKLQLTDDIRKYMNGDFPNLQYQDHPIRIVDLSNHTSGLPVELPNLDTFKNAFDVLRMYDSYTNAQFLADIRKVKIDTLPGTRYGYSNAGVKLLGIILEKVYGQTYAGLLKKYITGPMQMKHTRIASAISDTTSYTKGYDGLSNPMPHVNFNMFGGAGSILSTAKEMLNYVEQNISEQIPAVKLAHRQTFASADGAMGLCWQINRKTVNGTRIWKSGGALGFRSYLAVVPEKKIGIIWLSNRSDLPEEELSDMVDKLLQEALKEE
ncbi:serine hydrolase domain-containing protein [Mucilaginibacter dorajii]|uniref:Beta-lactamase-related domain-containing protein n=1 Tax=Mucilaginibacter dorajii TaxID=692994 RepID=A0ABP7R040_9SPHI|nr:serine hydrolase domain-containing protein [Mucilaginibacter dorajii]MCS3732198.1 CubicO group peptidase (beta-lactamase class C family) [Mucilaginibacter dorajii]